VVGLALLVLVAWVPWFNSEMPARWIVLSLGLPLVSAVSPAPLPRCYRGALLIAFGWMALGLAWSPDPWGGAGELIGFALLAGVMIAASSVEIRPVMTACLWAVGVSAAVAVVEMVAGSEPLGLFGNRDLLAETAAPVFVWAVIARANLVAIGLAVIPLAICGSRTALAAALVGLLTAARWWALVLVMPALLWSSVSGKSASLAERLTIWHIAAANISWRGTGLGWFAAALPQYQYAHSDLLQGLVELGAGAVLFVGLAGWLLWQANGELRPALLSSLVTAAGSFALHAPASGFVAAVLAGGVVGAWYRERGTISLGRVAMGDDSGKADAGNRTVDALSGGGKRLSV
jgi:hypothetical protein